MKRLFAVLMTVLFTVAVLAGCGAGGGMYKDGDYSAKSDPDQRGNYAEIKITVKDGKIAAADWKEFSKDGKEKGENYGKGGKEEDYKKAQDALKASKTFGSKLVEVQEVGKVDAVSGATNSHKLFAQLANKALEKAKK